MVTYRLPTTRTIVVTTHASPPHTHTHARPRRDDATTRAVAFQAALDRIESIEGGLAERFESADRASLTRIEGELVEVHRARDTVVARDAQVERAA